MSEEQSTTTAELEAQFVADRLGSSGIEMLFAVNSLEKLVKTSKNHLADALRASAAQQKDDQWWEAMHNLLVHYAVYSEMMNDMVALMAPVVETARTGQETVKTSLEHLEGVTVLAKEMTEHEKALMKHLPQVEDSPEPLFWGYGTPDIN